MKNKFFKEINAVMLDDDNDQMIILDQTRLPGETKFIRISSGQDIWEAIYFLKVRGAPAIGIAAAYGVYLLTKKAGGGSYDDVKNNFIEAKNFLSTSRPTAVNLFWALERMERKLYELMGREPYVVFKALREEAEAIRKEDENVCLKIGEAGLKLLDRGMGILTHCNAGTIATARYGTALSPIYLGHERGYNFRVYADETRPLLQGARLTAWELMMAGVDVTLLCDNMAASLMKAGKIQAVLVGCDRVAANGDAANKIGTLGVAILAKHYNIPFYVCAPTSTIDFNCKTGNDIHVEQRPPEEVTEKWYSEPMAPGGVKVVNPAFDVTDNELITAIVTEKGVLRAPYYESIMTLL